MTMKRWLAVSAVVLVPWLAETTHAADDAPSSAAAPEVAVTQPDLTSIKTVSPSTRWTYTPDAQASTGAAAPAQTLELAPGSLDQLAHDDVLRFSSDGAGILAAVHVIRQPGKPDEHLLERINVRTGKSLGQQPLPEKTWLASLSPDGQRVVLLKSVPGADHSRVEVLDFSHPAPSALVAFDPAPIAGDGREINDALAIDAQHILTYAKNRKLTLWDITGAKALYGTTVAGNPAVGPVLSPGRSFFATEDAKGIYFFHSLTGDPAGTIPLPVVPSYPTMTVANAFSPDAKRFAHVTPFGVRLFALDKEGKPDGQIPAPPGVALHKAQWVAADYLLLNDRYLASASKGLIVWEYGIDGQKVRNAAFADRLWLLKEASGHVTARACTVPDARVREVVDKLDPATIFAIKPGVQVTLEMDVGNDPEIQKALRAHFAEQLAANGVTLADGQPLKLIVTIADADAREVRYKTLGAPRTAEGNTTKVDRKKMDAAFVVGDTAAWDAVIYSNAPLMVRRKPGQSIESAIQQKQANDWHMLEALDLPPNVPAPRDPVGFGQTPLDPDPPR